MIKRHTRKSQQNPQGAIIEREGIDPHLQCDESGAFDARAGKRTTEPATS